MRRIVLAVVGVVCVLAVLPSPSRGQIVRPDIHRAYIKSVKWPGMCLDARYDQFGDGADVWLWPCNGTRPQMWTLRRFDSSGGAIAGRYMIISNHDLRCLDNDLRDARNVQRWGCLGFGRPLNQVWAVQGFGDGSFWIRNEWSRRYLDAYAWAAPPGDFAPAGTLIQTWQFVGWENQRWTIHPF